MTFFLIFTAKNYQLENKKKIKKNVQMAGYFPEVLTFKCWESYYVEKCKQE